MSGDWDPAAYARFEGLRRRPVLDLLARVGDLPAGDVVDLGCGTGAAGPLLAALFPGRRLTGVDASPAMLGRAAETGAYDRLDRADAGAWVPDQGPALILANALLHWLPDPLGACVRLAGMPCAGGWLAVQMPGQAAAPSHRLLAEVSAALFPGRPDPAGLPGPVPDAAMLEAALAAFGAIDAWETVYAHRLPAAPEGHPVRAFTGGAAMRPWVAGLGDAPRAAFLEAYDERLATAYPLRADGSVLFPFRRVFAILRV